MSPTRTHLPVDLPMFLCLFFVVWRTPQKEDNPNFRGQKGRVMVVVYLAPFGFVLVAPGDLGRPSTPLWIVCRRPIVKSQNTPLRNPPEAEIDLGLGFHVSKT